jgi:hypothetical protein
MLGVQDSSPQSLIPQFPSDLRSAPYTANTSS